MKEHPTHPAAALFPLLEGETFEALVEDVRRRGLRNPITLDKTGLVLDGRNRYRACAEAKVEPIFDEYEGDDALGFVVSQNIARRHLSDSQRAMVAARALVTLNLDWASNLKIFNVGRGTLAHAKQVLDKGVPELVAAVDSGAISVTRAAEITALAAEQQAELAALPPGDAVANHERIKRDSRRTEIIRRANEPKPGLPMEGATWPVVYADPPWTDEFGVTNRATENHYALMTTPEIVDLAVAKIAAPDAVLFLWALPHMIEQGLMTMRQWGFAYRTHMVWDKNRRGMGQWVRNAHELLLIGRRGQFPPPPEALRAGSVVRVLGSTRHSAKPDIFPRMIESWYPEARRIELFRRGRPRPGWDAWGAEAQQAAE